MIASRPAPVADGRRAGCVIGAELGRGAAWRLHAAHDEQLARVCELLTLALDQAPGAELLARARQLAAYGPRWTQTVVRIDEVGDAAWVVLTVGGGEPLRDAVATASRARALACVDQALVALAEGRQHRLAPTSLARATVRDGAVLVPAVDVIGAAGVAPTRRAELCALLATLGDRADLPAASQAVLEAFDRDLYAEVDELRGALHRSAQPWWRRHPRVVAALGALVVVAVAALGLVVHRAWTRPPPLDVMIRDDLPARVAQMRAMARRGEVIAHDRGPDLSGAWFDVDTAAAPVMLAPVGAAAGGQWRFDRGTDELAPDEPGYWRHTGVLTLRAIEGRRFLSGTLHRSPELTSDQHVIEIELEVRGDHLLLRTSVFHDPGVGWSFAYFVGDFERARNAARPAR